MRRLVSVFNYDSCKHENVPRCFCLVPYLSVCASVPRLLYKKVSSGSSGNLALFQKPSRYMNRNPDIPGSQKTVLDTSCGCSDWPFLFSKVILGINIEQASGSAPSVCRGFSPQWFSP
jgi:hypothetical protein